MNFLSLLIPLLFASFILLKADTISLINGETMRGQLIKVSSSYLIFEVIDDSNRVSTLSLNHGKVLSVKDESNRTLYSHGTQQVKDLENYYKKTSLPFIYKKAQTDTIILKNGEQRIGHITSFTQRYINYRLLDKQSQSIQRSKVEDIETINGEKIHSFFSDINPYYTFPKENISTFARPSIGFGFTLIQHKLNEYKTIYNLGFDIRIRQDICFAFTGNFTMNFDNDEDFYEDTEGYRLFTFELRYTLPIASISPWIGAGYAMQSLTIINRINNVDIKLKSQSSKFLLAAGIIFNSSSRYGFIISLRYLPFGEEYVNLPANVELQSTPKINLSCITLSTSVFFDL
jgi:sRNA-binding regulator protein Hfq